MQSEQTGQGQGRGEARSRGRIGTAVWLGLAASWIWFTGCTSKPALQVGDVRRVTFQASGNSWEASPSEIATFVEAYHQAKVRQDDRGTTPPAGADVLLNNGEVLKFWGGSEGIQGVWYRGREIDLEGKALGEILGAVAARP